MEAQLVKQGLAQLLGAVHVELVAHLSVDILQDAVQLAPQAVAKGADAVGVYRKADALHVRQHAGQRQLHLIVQFALAAGVQFGGQPFQQRGQHPGIGGGFAVERRRHAVLGSQRLYRIAASGRIEQIRGQLAVKMQGFANMPLLQCQAVEGLRVKGPDFGIAVQQGGQAVGVWQVDFLSLYGVPAAVGVLGHKQAAFHQQRQGSRL